MTSGLRRRARRSQSHYLSTRLAALRRRGGALLGTFAVHLLGKNRV